jgi:hypothetical protein
LFYLLGLFGGRRLFPDLDWAPSSAATERYGERKPVDAPDWANTLDARLPRKLKQQRTSPNRKKKLHLEPESGENPRPVRHLASPFTPHPESYDCRAANAQTPVLPKYGVKRTMSMKSLADGSIQNPCPNDCHDNVDQEKSEQLERT